MEFQEIIKKLNISVEFLKEKQSFKVEDLWLVPVSDNVISVNGTSNFSFKENLTKETAINELKNLKSKFNLLKEQAIPFLSFIKGKEIQYCILINYGMGSELIAKEKNGIIELYL